MNKKRKIGGESKKSEEKFKYLEHIKEKEDELKILLEKLDFHILIEIILFTEAQNLKIFYTGGRFCITKEKKDIILINLEYDIVSEEIVPVKTKIKLEYIKIIFGYFKNDKFRNPFQIIRSFGFQKHRDLEWRTLDYPIDISSIIPLKRNILKLAFYYDVNTIHKSQPLNIIFEPNLKISIKKIFFKNIKLSSSVNKLLENVSCEEFQYSFYRCSTKQIELTTGLKHLRSLSISVKSINIFKNDADNKFNYSECFMNLEKLTFMKGVIGTYIDITKGTHLDFMVKHFKKLKSFRIECCSIQIIDLLDFLKVLKIKHFYTHRSRYSNIEQLKNVYKPENIEKYKNSTLESISIIGEEYSWFPRMLYLLFNNIEEIDIRISDESIINTFLKNTDKSKLKKMKIDSKSISYFSYDKFLSLNSLEITYRNHSRRKYKNFNYIISHSFLKFLESCNIREFSFFFSIVSDSSMKTEIKRCIEMFFESFNKNQNMQFLEVKFQISNLYNFRSKFKFENETCIFWKKR